MSLRTLYRDIAALKAQGAAIEGEAGFGYVLRPGFTLPPLMFTLDEVEALALGARWVEGRADEGLARSAKDALAKIAAVLPPERAAALDWPTLLAGRAHAGEAERAALPLARKALADERKLAFGYADKDGRRSQRTVWPVAIGFFEFGDDARGVVRDARGLPPLPPRPHGPRRGPPRPPAKGPPEPAQGLAAGGGARGVRRAGPPCHFRFRNEAFQWVPAPFAIRPSRQGHARPSSRSPGRGQVAVRFDGLLQFWQGPHLYNGLSAQNCHKFHLLYVIIMYFCAFVRTDSATRLSRRRAVPRRGQRPRLHEGASTEGQAALIVQSLAVEDWLNILVDPRALRLGLPCGREIEKIRSLPAGRQRIERVV